MNKQQIMEVAERVGLIGPGSRVADSHAAVERLADVLAAPEQEPVNQMLLAALVRDAERYRWLFSARTETECHDENAGMVVLPQDVVLGTLSSWYYPKEGADKAIDAAIAAQDTK